MKRLHYNAPVILTFFLLCLGALLLGALSRGWTTLHLFSVYRAPLSPLFLVRLLGHVLGHADWDHFRGNMLLLLGIGLTALISGVLRCLFFPGTVLLGASGIVFMLIMLSSLAGMRSGSIPLTLVLTAALYLGQEVYAILFVSDQVANFMHLVGGACGTAFGFAAARRSAPP